MKDSIAACIMSLDKLFRTKLDRREPQRVESVSGRLNISLYKKEGSMRRSSAGSFVKDKCTGEAEDDSAGRGVGEDDSDAL